MHVCCACLTLRSVLGGLQRAGMGALPVSAAGICFLATLVCLGCLPVQQVHAHCRAAGPAVAACLGCPRFQLLSGIEDLRSRHGLPAASFISQCGVLITTAALKGAAIPRAGPGCCLDLYCLFFCCRGVVHRDLKLENLLLTIENDISKLKIADFGLAKKAQEAAMNTICGTPQYVAPEVIQVGSCSLFRCDRVFVTSRPLPCQMHLLACCRGPLLQDAAL